MARIIDVTDSLEYPGAAELHFDDGKPPMLVPPDIADEHKQRLEYERDAMRSVKQDLGLPTAINAGVAGPGVGAQPALEPGSGQAEDAESLKNTARSVQRWLTRPSDNNPEAARKWDEAHSGSESPGGGGQVDPVDNKPLPPGVRVATPEEMPAPKPAPPAAAPAAGQPAPGVAPAQPGAPAQPEETEEEDPLAAARARATLALAQGYEMVPGKPGATTDRTSTERGAPYDPKAGAERVKAAKAVLDAELAKAQSEQARANAIAAHAEAQNLAARDEAARRQADMVRRKQQYEAQEAGLQKELKDYSESHAPDPKRFFSTPLAGVAQMLSIIGQGLGAFAATRAGTENFAFKAAQAAIQHELAAQEKAYDAGRGDRKNALARLTDHYNGDLEMGKLALQQALNKVAETETTRLAAQSRSDDITNNAKLLTAQFAQQQLLAEQQRQELAAGKTTMSHESATTPGHRENLTPEQVKAYNELVTGKTGGLKPKEAADSLEKYGSRRADFLDAKLAAEHLASAYGLKVNRDTGELTLPDGSPVDPDKIDISGSGPLGRLVPDFFKSDEGREVARLQLEMATKYRLASSGVAFKPQEMEEARKHESGIFDRDSVRILAQRISDLYRKETELDASYPPEIVHRWNDQNKAIHRERTRRGAAAPKIKPYKPGGS